MYNSQFKTISIKSRVPTANLGWSVFNSHHPNMNEEQLLLTYLRVLERTRGMEAQCYEALTLATLLAFKHANSLVVEETQIRQTVEGIQNAFYSPCFTLNDAVKQLKDVGIFVSSQPRHKYQLDLRTARDMGVVD